MCHFGVQLKGSCRLWKGFDEMLGVAQREADWGGGGDAGRRGGGGGTATYLLKREWFNYDTGPLLATLYCILLCGLFGLRV